MTAGSAKHGPRGAVTLRTLADAAGVHVSTVSRALNPAEAHKVSDATVARIRRLAEEHGFEPNPWARSLRTNRTRLIGLIIPRLVDGVLAIMFEAAAARAQDFGYQAITFSTQDRDEEQGHLIDVLLERRVDGLIIATATERDHTLDRLTDEGIPFVLMNRASGDHPVVRSDDVLGARMATEHVIAAGHERIAMLAGPDGVSTSSLRRQGFREAHHAHGMSLDERLIVPCTFHADGALKVADELLGLAQPPTAIVAVNDATAIGAMAAARDRGLSIPHDLAVIGYNDSPIAAMLPVELSSIAVPLEEVGRLSVQMLMRRLDGEEVESVVIPPTLKPRRSTAPDATR